MSADVRATVREAVLALIKDCAATQTLQRRYREHLEKVHFVPARYRVLGGVLQSLNIRFGNFIEKLVHNVIENDGKVNALPISGKRVALSFTARTDALIDQYITSRQLADSADRCDDEFNALLSKIIVIEADKNLPKQTINKDIDALFTAQNGKFIFAELKYNDDHDTEKFVDINRKFIKTFAGIVNRLGTTDISQIKPVIYYFNPRKRWGPIYTPSSNIYGGDQLFKEHFETSYAAVDGYLREIGEDEAVIKLFDDLYNQIRFSIARPAILPPASLDVFGEG